MNTRRYKACTFYYSRRNTVFKLVYDTIVSLYSYGTTMLYSEFMPTTTYPKAC